jgi:hypothetical protein
MSRPAGAPCWDRGVPARTEFCADPDGFQTTWLPIRGNLLKLVNLAKLNLVSRNARAGQAITQLLCRPTLPRRQPVPAVRNRGT